jgi:hypothetical protein
MPGIPKRCHERTSQETGNYLRVRAGEALPEVGGGGVFAGAEHGAAVSVVLLDAAPGDDEQQAHMHPVEEVVVVQQGVGSLRTIESTKARLSRRCRYQVRLITPGSEPP